VLTAGVLDPRKNVATLIEALAACDGVDQERLELVIAGQGPEAMSLGRLVHEKGLSNVKLLGWRSDVGELMQSASVLVHPALHEGVANTVLEALARDLPILVSDIPEHREIFSEETVLVSPNSVEAWCRVFQRLSDTAFLDDVRAASRRLASKLRFDWDERASKLVIEA
jgi:glycosyltransferase involved in cell wall biosynthesis